MKMPLTLEMRGDEDYEIEIIVEEPALGRRAGRRRAGRNRRAAERNQSGPHRRRTELEGTSDLGDELEETSKPAENDLSKEKTEQR